MIGRVIVVVLATFLPLSLLRLNTGNSIVDFVLTSMLIVTLTAIAMFMLGLERFERDFIKARVRNFI